MARTALPLMAASPDSVPEVPPRPAPAYSANDRTVSIAVTGMHCAACVGRVQSALEHTPGVSSAVVNLMTNSATVVFNPGQATPSALVESIKSTGYGAELPAATQTAAEEQEGQDARRRDEYMDY